MINHFQQSGILLSVTDRCQVGWSEVRVRRKGHHTAHAGIAVATEASERIPATASWGEVKVFIVLVVA